LPLTRGASRLPLMVGEWISRTRWVWAATREAGASLLTYEMYPLGVLPRVNLRLWGGAGKGKVPILFLHGVFHNPSTFTWIRRQLRREGHTDFGEINLFNSLKSIEHNAKRVGVAVERLKARSGAKTVDLVAHSMGGIVARYYVQMLGGESSIRNLITLATPHQGIPWARYSVFPGIREIAPEHPTIKALREAPLPAATQSVAISGELDILMRPTDCDRWPGVRNIRLKDVGHAGLLFSERVVQILVSHLNSPPPTAKLHA